MNTSSTARIRIALFFAQGALFALLMSRILGAYVPNAVFLPLGAAFGLCGLILIIQVVRSGETGLRKWFFTVTGASAAGIVLGAVLHNVGTLLHSPIVGIVFFFLALIVFPVLFVGSWFGSLVLLGAAGEVLSKQRKQAAGLAAALAVGALVGTIVINLDGEGYSVTSQVLHAPDLEIQSILITIEVDAPLVPVFQHSFRHSLASAFSSNGITATLEAPPASDAAPGSELADTSATDVDRMHISVRPLYRTHPEGYEAIVGTLFDATLIDATTGEEAWRLSGTVDYIAEQFFRQHGFRAHAGMIKEFAWRTSAAIVRTFMIDVAGRESVRIHTSTEEREVYGQRID